MEEHGICEVTGVSEWNENAYTIGVVKFQQKWEKPPTQIQLTASQEGRPEGWLGLLCSVIKVTETHLIIDFDGWKVVDGVPKFLQEVYPGAKCYWKIES